MRPSTRASSLRPPGAVVQSVEGLSDERVAGEEHDDERHDEADEGWMGDVIPYCAVDVAACTCPTCETRVSVRVDI